MRPRLASIIVPIVTLLVALAMPVAGSDSRRGRDVGPRRDALEPRVWCTITRVPKDEGDPEPFIVRVERDGDTAEELIAWLKLGGTMTPDVDYIAPPPCIIIPAGRASREIRIPLINDDLVEDVETFEISAGLRPEPRPAPTTAPDTRPSAPATEGR